MRIGAILFAVCMAAVAMSYWQAADSRADGPAAQPGKVLKHMVLYQFKDGLPPGELQEVIDTFAGLPEQIDTIIGFEHGANVSEEGKSEGLTHCFVVTFRNQYGLQTYLTHPAHMHYVEVVKDRREKVVVFDYWAEE